MTNLSRGFIARAEKCCIDAFLNRLAERPACSQNCSPVFSAVDMRHIRKARAKAVIVTTDEWALALYIDVIRHDDQRCLLIFEIDAAGCISENDRANTHAAEDAHRKSDLLGRITFIEMDASLHRCQRDAVSFPNHHLAGVANRG